jgi:hypothetical protein
MKPLPCPFCGAKPVVEYPKSACRDTDVWVRCDNVLCPMWKVQSFAKPTREEAIAAWNIRK